MDAVRPVVLQDLRSRQRQPRAAWHVALARMAFRGAWLMLTLAGAMGRWWRLRVRTAGPLTWRARAEWQRDTARRLLHVMNARPCVDGPLPQSGVLVTNHLSYLDIVVIASLVPAVFVSKRDVRSWPVFGWLARMSGTVFVHRERRADAARATAAIERLLGEEALVVLFPEGTSSDGTQVLPFRSSLLEAPARLNVPVHTAGLQYALPDGDPSQEVCYWGPMTLAPHLLNLLGKCVVSARIVFGGNPLRQRDRKELARVAHQEVSLLRAEASLRLAQPLPPTNSL